MALVNGGYAKQEKYRRFKNVHELENAVGWYAANVGFHIDPADRTPYEAHLANEDLRLTGYQEEHTGYERVEQHITF